MGSGAASVTASVPTVDTGEVVATDSTNRPANSASGA